MKRVKYIAAAAMMSMVVASCATDYTTIYKDATQTPEKRADALLELMTIEEKVAQMCQYVGPDHIRETQRRFKGKVAKNDDAYGFYKDLSINDLLSMTEQGMIGSFLHVVTIKESNELQALAMKSRLGIPLIIGIDAIHGNAMCAGATVYPTCIGQASTFNPELIEKMSRESALEVRATGAHWTFTPNIEVARDPRWGRIGETFGEDPYLVTRMGVATIKGYQGEDCSGENSVVACAKHLIAGSEPSNGTNAAPMDVSEHTLREVFLPPYKAAVEEANVYSAMAAHNELNGVPCHANGWILNDIFRGEYGFDGFIVSDWMDIERIHTLHHYASTPEEASLLSVEEGVDMHMHGPHYLDHIVAHVKSGRLAESRVDEACRKILEAKFRLGLFENPYIDEAITESTLFKAEHQATSLEAAHQSIVLLKNEDLLPLDLSKYKKIMVTGPNANNQSVLGDWTLQQPDENVVTILKGVQERVPASQINYYNYGDDVRSTDMNKVREAKAMAERSDLAIVVVGENPIRYQRNRTSGENTDRMTLDLMGVQEELIKAIHNTGTPTIVVLVGGRPLAVNWCKESVPAIIQAWEPGSFAGRAVMDIITGNVNPSAKLPVTIPRHVGQIQMIYNHKPSQYFHNYDDGDISPLYRFGYGLSYTQFEFSKPTLSKATIGKSDSVEVSFTLTNVGKRDGTEVAQLYIRDLYSSVTRPVKELKDFARVELKAGESREVKFTITPDKLSMFNKAMEYVVEAGEFEIMVGSSSADEDLQKVVLNVI